MELMIVIAILAIIIAIVAPLYDTDYRNITLSSKEWVCTKTESKTIFRPMMVGKVMINQVIPSSECIEYRRVGK